MVTSASNRHPKASRKRFTFDLDERLHARLKAAAKKEDIKISQVVRRAVHSYLTMRKEQS